MRLCMFFSSEEKLKFLESLFWRILQLSNRFQWIFQPRKPIVARNLAPKPSFSCTLICAYVLHPWPGSTRMVTTCTGITDIDSHHNSHTIETICDIVSWEKVLALGVFVPDMVHLVNFWGTPKIKKFINISIKVHKDEICSTSVWYH